MLSNFSTRQMAVLIAIFFCFSTAAYSRHQLIFSDNSANPFEFEKSFYYDSAYNPAIKTTGFVYFDQTQGVIEKLMYAAGSSFGSLTTPVEVASKDPSSLIFYKPFLVYDSGGNPHILLNKNTTTILHYSLSGGKWVEKVIFQLDTNAFPNTDVTINAVRIGNDNVIHLLLASGFNFSYSDFGIFYLSNDGGAFATTLETVERLDDALGRSLDMVLDSANKAHIVYSTINVTRYLNNRSGSWVGEDIFRDNDIDYWPAEDAVIALDHQSNPAIVASERGHSTTGSTTYSKLRYIKRTAANQWESTVVADSADGYSGSDGNQFTGENPIVFFDNSGNPNILFSDIAASHNSNGYSILKSGQIRHAKYTDSNWQISTVYQQTPVNTEILGLLFNHLNAQEINFTALEVIREGDIFSGFESQQYHLYQFNIDSTITTSATPTPIATPTPTPTSIATPSPTPTATPIPTTTTTPQPTATPTPISTPTPTDTPDNHRLSIKPNILINGKKTEYVALNEPVTLSLTLDISDTDNFDPKDWWLAVNSPFGLYSYHYPNGWQPGLNPALTSTPLSLVPFEVQLPSGLPVGHYDFYFALDDNADGEPDGTYMDQAGLDITTLDHLPPYQPTIVQAYAATESSVLVRWLAGDNQTDIFYEIHASENNNFTPDSSTLKTTVTDQYQATIENLESGKTYFIVVLPISASKIKGEFSQYHEITLPTGAFQLKPNVSLFLANQGSQSYPVTTHPSLTFNHWQETTLPQIDDIFIGPSADNGYLRKVTAVTQNGESLNISGENSSLADIFANARVTTSQQLFDVADTTQRMTAQTGLRRSLKPNQWSISWPDQNLVATETIPYSATNPVRRMADGKFQLPLTMAKHARSTTTTETTSAMTFTLDFGFEPHLKSEIDWSWGSINSGEISMSGELFIDILAKYHASIDSEYTKSYELFERQYQSVYLIGSVPVYQKINFALSAQITTKANAGIDASAHADASTSMSVGVRYNTETGSWDPILDTEFRRMVALDLNAEGSVVAEIRLIPEITVTFYDFASSTLSIEPYLSSSIAASVDDIISKDRQVNLALGLECQIGVNLKALYYDIALISQQPICGPDFDEDDYAIQIDEFPIVSPATIDMPTVWRGRSGEELEIELINGTNNPIIFQSINSSEDLAENPNFTWSINSNERVEDKQIIKVALSTDCRAYPTGASGNLSINAKSRLFEKNIRQNSRVAITCQ